jgi:hypothetical protein
MTELEYEKACRGPLASVDGEYAWGTPDLNTLFYTLTNQGQASEIISNPSSFLGNSVSTSSGITGPVRGGIFATASSTRLSSGAGYYGAMELSGNLYEYCVCTCNAAGRSYNGKHGDGILTTVIGNANENYWPGINGSTNANAGSGVYDGGAGVRANTGILHRGNSWVTSGGKVSYRFTITAVLLDNTAKFNDHGIRGARDGN